MGRLREWALDWLGRSDVRGADRRIDDPLALLQRVFAALAGLAAILSSPAIGALAPNLSPSAALALRVVIALVTLAAVNYVVTAKDVVETVSGLRSQTLRTYRFSTTERLVARGVVAVALLLLVLNLTSADPPRACNLTATVTWQPPNGSARPLFLSLTAGGREYRYNVEPANQVAIEVPAEHVPRFSMSLLWSDNSRSDFGEFSGCSALASRGSGDGRAKIDLAVR